MTNILCGGSEADILNALSFCSMIVTDVNVAKLYPKYTKNAYVIPEGESSKSPEVLFSIIAEMSKRNIKRDDVIAAVGGGVVGDVTGLAAALYMRGIDWINIPTTMLAMVDAGIGGKTAVNVGGVKNVAGVFHAPKSTVISFEFLETLYEREWLCGYGELVKTCLLTKHAYEQLKARVDGLLEFDRDDVYALIQECVNIKRAVVAADPKEKALRKILNVGHTVGHALESLDCGRLSHGEYIMKGMMTECAMCNDIIDEKYYNELNDIFYRFTTPPRTTAKSVCEFALKDKKNTGDTITLMLPVSPGEILDVRIAQEDFLSRYDRAIKEMRKA